VPIGEISRLTFGGSTTTETVEADPRVWGCLVLSACRSPEADVKPVIEFTHVPPAGPGGPTKTETIEGRVKGALPGQRLVLYANSVRWWVQPFSDQPYTNIRPDSTWSSPTHIGTEYAALLVDPHYVPRAKPDSLPGPGNGVIAVAIAPGGEVSTPVSTTLHFSGYDWDVREFPIDGGGARNDADRRNAWIDSNGCLHLRISHGETGWRPAEVTLRRSLGYGSYRFVVRDVSHLEPATVLTMFTFDDSDSDPSHRQVTIEISRWGDPVSKNAQYVLQPYDVPANAVRFNVPSGRVTHAFRWQPGRVLFQTFRETGIPGEHSMIAENVFTSGVPVPGGELLHLNLYVYSKPRIPMEREAEVVVEKFEYLP